MNSSQMRALNPTPPPTSTVTFVEGERKNLNSELWHACAGPLVSLPAVGSRVVYLPQGHSEQVAASTQKEADAHIPAYPSLPPQLFCQLHDVILHADMETDEVYCQMTLQPLTGQEKEHFLVPDMGSPSRQPNLFFCKTLTASDTSTHGGFSIPRRAAEKVFPPLDYNQQPPAQELIARDLHDTEWKFRHIYRGQPKRHLLTTGWSVFVSAKRLLAGDSVLFIRNDKGQLLLGIRRANRPQTVLPSSVLSSDSMHIGVLAAAAHAASTNSRFTVFYNPRASPSEFVIPYAKFEKAVYHTRVSVGMRFRMLFETEESSVRRYMGTITDISDLDPVRWPNSQWRSIKVGWDESTACERQRRVSLWEIEPLTTFLVYPPTSNWRLKHPWSQPVGASFSNDFEMDSLKKQSMWVQFHNGNNVYNSLVTHGMGVLPENLASKQLNFQPQNPIIQSDHMLYRTQAHRQSQLLLQQQQQQQQQQLQQLQSQPQPLHQPFIHQSHLQQQPMLQSQAQPQPQYPSQSQHLVASQQVQSQLQSQPPPQQQTQQPQMQPAPQHHQQQHLQHQHHLSLPQQQQEFQSPQQVPVTQTQPPMPSFQSSAFALQHQKNATVLQQQAQQQQPNYSPALQQNLPSQVLHPEQSQRQPSFSSPNMTNVLNRLPSSQPQGTHNGAAATQSAVADSNATLNSTNVSQTLQSIFSGFVPDTSPLHTNSMSTSPHFTKPPAMLSGSELHQEPSVPTSWMPGASQLSSRSQTDLVNTTGTLGGMCVTTASIGSSVLSKFSPEVPSNTYCYKEFSQEHDDMQPDLSKQSFGGNGDLQPMLISTSSVSRSFTGTNEFQNQCASNFMQSQSALLGADMSFGSSISTQASDDAHFMQQAYTQTSPPVRTYTKVYKTGSVGRSLDVTRFSNYTELRCELAKLFGLEGQLEDKQSGWQLIFVDKENDWLLLGDDPWEVFVNNVRSIKILSPAEVFQMQDGVGLLPIQRQTSSSSDDGTIQQDSRNPSSVITSTGSLDY